MIAKPLCPLGCGFPLDYQCREPATWWCGWCWAWFDGEFKLTTQSPRAVLSGRTPEAGRAAQEKANITHPLVATLSPS